jgi:hypothetical protein
MDGVTVTKLSAEQEYIYKTIYQEIEDLEAINKAKVVNI